MSTKQRADIVSQYEQYVTYGAFPELEDIKNNLLIYNRVVGKMKVVYPFYESVIIKKPKKVNV